MLPSSLILVLQAAKAALGIVIATNFIEAVMTMLRRQAAAMTVIH